ncbi:galactoside O-acetyltransferase [Marivirga sericea]|uniref:Galactoside O-acetyltransferase n=1 Tax=Marivirga sericea TaxID=1028 RepID=A0A1X7IKS6_9BACT|nr:acyltransferase [Marivirga sericea]SMG15121.1 galactoside O-acetyltransferase [Marivirga sericea]
MAFLSTEKLNEIGFKSLGENVMISDKVSIYNPKNIQIGSNVRIDDFCILSAGEKGISIGNYVHIACYVSLIGKELIDVQDYVGISSKSAVYSSSDNYSGEYLVGPTIPDQYKDVDHRPVIFEEFSLIGAGSVILPGVTVGRGTAVGALSLVVKSLDYWGVYIGSPVKFIKERKRDLIQKAEQLKAND